MKKQEIGGSRLGSGGKLSVEMKNYERSTHDLSYVWRSSMSVGTLIPFMKQVCLPGDTWDIDLQSVVMTHPTLGPLFGSFKLQLDVFEAPLRLYHATLMQNIVGVGTNIASIVFPTITTSAIPAGQISAGAGTNPDNIQCHPSALLSYLGLRGWGASISIANNTRSLNGIPLLAYWEIYKNYYANKQEGNGYYLLPGGAPGTGVISTITVGATTLLPGNTTGTPIAVNNTTTITVNYGAGTAPQLAAIYLITAGGSRIPFTQVSTWTGGGAGPSTWVSVNANNITTYVTGYGYYPAGSLPALNSFSLGLIDNMKSQILQAPSTLNITAASVSPYGPCITLANTPFSQCGLGIKTYQSDVNNNWLSTATFNTITTNTQVSTAGNIFTIDSLILARKVYDLLNRVAISGNTYQDWINAAYGHEPYSICQVPIYHGGLSKEIIFQEVVSLSQNSQANQPLGTLAGRGTISQKHKGGRIRIKVNEPGYIMGIVSITPRLDYSQGNDWDIFGLKTMNDLHKPALDQIGFQQLITEQLAWWDTSSTSLGVWVQNAAGYQPAWINYMTNVNKCYGNFAELNNEMFMTLNRRYQCQPNSPALTDLTTYIDPSHYNFIFAQTSLDAQNFWTQIAVNLEVRRIMSAKIMPNL